VRKTLVGFPVLLTLLVGCLRLTPGTGAPQSPRVLPSVVRIGIFEEPDVLNPILSQMTFSGDVFQLVFDGLVRFDDRGRAVPDLAREVPSLENGGISADGRTLTYHLMPGARWHDGLPVTARDVIFTWHAIMNPANDVPLREGFERIVAMDAPDPLTVRVHLARPYPPAVFLFASILPEHLLGKLSDLNRATFNAHPVGSGPYVFAGWIRGSELTFRANPRYFRGEPTIHTVIVKVVTNQNTLLQQLRTREIDVDLKVPAQLVRQIGALPGIRIRSSSTLHWEHLNFNTGKAPLDDVNVRRALCMAIDERAIFRDFYYGYGTMAPTHFNPDFGWGDPSVRYLRYDPVAAGAALDTDGWLLASDGFRYKRGTRFAFDLSTIAGVKTREAIEVFLQSAWRGLGADVSIRNYQAATFFAPRSAGGLLASGKSDVSIFTWENTNPDPNDQAYVTTSALPPNGQNYSFYKNPQLDTLERRALTTLDGAKRHELYREIDRILIRDVPEYVLDWQPEIVAFDARLHGVRPVPIGSDLWNLADWSYVP